MSTYTLLYVWCLGRLKFPSLSVSLSAHSSLPPWASLQGELSKKTVFNTRAYQASAYIILAYVCSLNFQFKWEGTVCMFEYWVVRFIGNCLQNNNLLQSASWFLKSHLSHMRKDPSPKDPRAL